jgi:hypothetical protein
MGAGMTIGVGLLGSFSAGLFSWYVLHRHGAGLILSVLFAMLILYALQAPAAAAAEAGQDVGPRRADDALRRRARFATVRVTVQLPR